MSPRTQGRTVCLAWVSVIGAALAVLCAPAADAAWSSAGAGQASAAAYTMPAGNTPAVVVSGTDVTLRWPAASFPNGNAVSGYLVQRAGANGQPVTALANCAGTVSTTTCTEHNVPSGTWTYTDAPVQGGWTGAASPASAPVTIP